MLRLRGSRTEANLRSAFSDEAELSGLCVSCAQEADADGYPDLPAELQGAAARPADYANVHLEYLIGSRVRTASGGMAREAAVRVIAMNCEHAGRHAGMGRTAQDEGFEDIADWFLTQAKSIADGPGCRRDDDHDVWNNPG